MSYKGLREKFEASSEELNNLDVFRRLYLESLFEINGNLDTIALTQRALVELNERLVKAEEVIAAHVIDNASKNTRTTKAK